MAFSEGDKVRVVGLRPGWDGENFADGRIGTVAGVGPRGQVEVKGLQDGIPGRVYDWRHGGIVFDDHELVRA